MGNIEYSIESVSSPEIIHYLDDKIYEFNSAAIQKTDGDYFSKVIRDSDTNIIAGVSGWTWASACEITLLWVKEEYRKKRLGEKLLNSVEEEAIRKKCSVILIRSYDFQAPSFYQKHGYKVEHVINDFPKGHKYYILIKRI